jgi:hypothetical protein
LALRAVVKASLLGARLDEHHLTRYQMYRSLSGLAQSRATTDSTVLSISGSDRMVKALGLESCQITRADFPEHDICSLKFPDQTFDFVVSD